MKSFCRNPFLCRAGFNPIELTINVEDLMVAIPFSIGQVSSMEDEFRFIVIKLYESQSLFL